MQLATVLCGAEIQPITARYGAARTFNVKAGAQGAF